MKYKHLQAKEPPTRKNTINYLSMSKIMSLQQISLRPIHLWFLYLPKYRRKQEFEPYTFDKPWPILLNTVLSPLYGLRESLVSASIKND